MTWKCRGVKVDGTDFDPHEEIAVDDDSYCPMCGLSQEDVEGKSDSLDSSDKSLPLLLLGAILAIVVAGGTSFWAFRSLLNAGCPAGQSQIEGECVPTEPPSAEVASHTNNSYGISLEYPDTWELRQAKADNRPNALSGAKDLFQFVIPDSEAYNYKPNILVKVEEVPSQGRPYLDDYVNQQVARIIQLGTFNIITEPVNNIQLGEEPARELIYEGNNGEFYLKRKRIIAQPINRNDSFLLITYTADVNDYENHLSKVEKIFESIRLKP